MNELALFAGAGGGVLGGHLLGWRTVCAVECDAYAASVLAQRQNDKSLPPFPIWSDIRNFNSKPWKGFIDVVSGGFPCQDISPARTNSRVNGRAKGLEGDKSGLWFEMLRIVNELSPRGFSLKTVSTSGQKGWKQSSKGLPKEGMLVHGLLFPLKKSGQITNERDSGFLPTPTAHNAKEGAYPAEYTRKTPTLSAAIGGKLHPEFTEWMMGWPIGWTGLEPLETDKYQQWLQTHSLSCKKRC